MQFYQNSSKGPFFRLIDPESPAIIRRKEGHEYKTSLKIKNRAQTANTHRKKPKTFDNSQGIDLEMAL